MEKKLLDPARIWTWNPLIRSQMPYPLGHRANYEWFKVEMNVLSSLENLSKEIMEKKINCPNQDLNLESHDS